MEKLIDFLLDNIYLVIVVVGFVLSAMGKSKNKGNRRTMRMPDFGGGGDSASDDEREPEPHRPTSGQHSLPSRPPSAERLQPHAVRRVAATGAQATVRPPAAEEDESYRSAKLQESIVTKETVKRRQSSSALSATARKPAVLGEETDAAAIRQAVVWAEILGPPRAKRPWGK